MTGLVGVRAGDRVLFFALWGALAALVGLVLLAPVADASMGVTERVSVSSDGREANAPSVGAAVSADGRVVAFESAASNLVAGDGNGTTDVFVRDRQTGVTERVSVGSGGVGANAASSRAAMSADGRFVTFISWASNLVAGDGNGTTDVFVRDRQTGVTERVSVGSGGGEANAASLRPSVSGDGRFVAFESYASNLVAGDTNAEPDVFVRDRQSGTTERVSVSSEGAQGNDAMLEPVVSADGRFVAFWAYASNLVAGDTNGTVDVFVRDRQRGVTERAGVGSDGAQANRGASDPVISADGRFVAFLSAASNLVPGGLAGAFVRDRQAGTTERLTYTTDPAISGDGRFVAFSSGFADLVEGDTNHLSDVFVRDRQTGATERVSVGPHGAQANQAGIGAGYPSISADGRVVAFKSGSTNLVVGDTNNLEDVFVHDRAAIDDAPADTAAPRVRVASFPFASPFARGPQQPALTRVRWAAGDASGICRVELEQSLDGGPFTRVAVLPGTATAADRPHAFGHRYRYRVRATDCVGNTSAWQTSWTFVPDALDATPDNTLFTGAWTPLPDADSYGGTLASSLTAGDSVSYTTSACRLAWIAPRDRDSGTAKVSVDGVDVATVSLATGDPHAPQRRPRRVVWQKAWPTTAPHTLRIQALSGRVDIDAIAVLRCSRS